MFDRRGQIGIREVVQLSKHETVERTFLPQFHDSNKHGFQKQPFINVLQNSCS